MIAWIVGGDGRTTPWSLHLGMPIQTNDPVIQIVDGDEERIRLGAPTADRTREEASDGNEYRSPRVFYDFWFSPIISLRNLSQESTRDMPVNIRQTIAAALEQVSQAFMVDSQLM